MSVKSLKKIVLIGLTLELGLAITYCLWSIYQTSIYPISITIDTTIIGIGVAIPIIALNLLLFFSPLRELPILKASNKFTNTVVKPFVNILNLPAALVISIAAGIGEELFFRGMLLSEIGLILSSILFSILHFGGTVKEFRFMAFLYFLIGLYFGWILIIYKSLWVLCTAHTVYDLTVIIFMKSYWKKHP